MSPEQLDDESSFKISTKSDMWAFGCVMIDVLTGLTPWTGDGPKAIYKKVVMQELAPPELKLLNKLKPPCAAASLCLLRFCFCSCFIVCLLPFVVVQAAEFAAKCFAKEPKERPTAAEAVSFCRARLEEAERAPKSDDDVREMLRRLLDESALTRAAVTGLHASGIDKSI